MWLLDQWAERHILEAQRNGEFDHLSGSGELLILDDDSHVPTELRAAYRLLKNSGNLPPELIYRRNALELTHLLKSIDHDDHRADELRAKLAMMELKLQQAGVNTEFLHGQYSQQLLNKINED
ncbi:DUF1992 domain-containing protein [Lelliottia sp. CFBP8978]|uniref:DnaJ family domain-containing protein n=1 Tax=Lelliottia sp. CFBP8978 TaxID=3096522 RepID=UPI002A6B680A|nr:DUF1992 domain-containing protein [Lelliottia sp. CFBP8978]MDY1039280.1 DUF1992 domain-containing protein [Lelliottia sp. CFBP8978]